MAQWRQAQFSAWMAAGQEEYTGEMAEVTQETTPSITSAALWSMLTSSVSIWRWITSILITHQPTHPFQVLTSILATVSNIKVNATPSPGFGLVLSYQIIVESTFALHFADIQAADVDWRKAHNHENCATLPCVWQVGEPSVNLVALLCFLSKLALLYSEKTIPHLLFFLQ